MAQSRSIIEARYRNKNKELVRQKDKRRVNSRKQEIESIALAYGCRNPDCQWVGKFEACQLEFHHLDPSTKKVSVAAMRNSSRVLISKEINKCVVLCGCCHALLHKFKGRVKIGEAELCRVDEELNIIEQ